jgi:hypothetical protein
MQTKRKDCVEDVTQRTAVLESMLERIRSVPFTRLIDGVLFPRALLRSRVTPRLGLFLFAMY